MDLFDKYGVKPPEVKAPEVKAEASAGADLFTRYKVEPLSQPDQYGVHDVGQTVSAERAKGPKGLLPFADDVVRNVAEGVTLGGADKAAAFLDRNVGQPLASGVRSLGADKLADYLDAQFGKGSYDELLAKQRKETEEAGGRLGPVGTFLAQAGGGMLTGAGLARQGLTLLGQLPASASLPMKMLAGGTEGSLYGAGSGVLHTDAGEVKDYLKNAAVGGLLGTVTGAATPAVVAGAQRVITPFPSTDPVRTQMAQTLRNEGVNVSAGEATGNRILRRTEDVVGNLPFGGDPTHGQMEQLTAAAMKRAGIGGGSRATADVLKDGFKNVGGTIGTIQGRYPVAIDDTALNQGVTIASDVNSVLTQPGEIAAAHRFIDRLTSGQQLDPKAAGELRTQLNKAITGARDSPNYQDTLINIKNSLDGALERTITSAGNHGDVAALNEARRQYANLHVLTDALSRSGPAGELGTLTPAALATALKGNLGKVGYMQGRGDLNELAKASAGLLTAPKSSQTAERWGALEPARILAGIAARPFVNSRMPFGGAQAYWGNQRAAAPIPPGLLQAPVAAGASAAGAQAGPADRLMQSILLGGP